MGRHGYGVAGTGTAGGLSEGGLGAEGAALVLEPWRPSSPGGAPEECSTAIASVGWRCPGGSSL